MKESALHEQARGILAYAIDNFKITWDAVAMEYYGTNRANGVVYWGADERDVEAQFRLWRFNTVYMIKHQGDDGCANLIAEFDAAHDNVSREAVGLERAA